MSGKKSENNKQQKSVPECQIDSKVLDKIDNLLLSLTSTVSLLFTILASIFTGIIIIYLIPLIIPSILLSIYFGYYKVINNSNLLYRVIGWTFFINGAVIYITFTFPIIMIELALNNIISSEYFIVLYMVGYALPFLVLIVNKISHPIKIVCSNIQCPDEIKRKAMKVFSETADIIMYYSSVWFGFFIICRFASIILTSTTYMLTPYHYIGITFSIFGIIYFGYKLYIKLRRLTNQ